MIREEFPCGYAREYQNTLQVRVTGLKSPQGVCPMHGEECKQEAKK